MDAREIKKIKNFLAKFWILRKIFNLSYPYKVDKFDEYLIEEMMKYKD